MKPDCTKRTAIWPIYPLCPAYQLRTVAPSSMVCRLVATQLEAAKLAKLRYSDTGKCSNRAVANAAPTTPNVPWGLMMSLIFVAMPMRATTS